MVLFILWETAYKMKFAVIDYECKNWNEILGLGFYDGTRYFIFYNTSDFINFIRQSDESWVIYAHNGGRYDFLFVLDYLVRQKTKPKDIIAIDSCIASFKVYDCEFRDSLRILPGSLKKIAPFFGQMKLEMDYEDIENQDWETYLKQDCVALWEILRKYFEYMDKHFSIVPSLTIASTAMKIYRKHFTELNHWKAYHEDMCRASYLGGRCEIFKMQGSDLNVYDINSMYPYVMRNYDFPVGKPEYKTGGNFDAIIKSEMLGIISASVVLWSDNYIPLLPVREKGKMLFCKGRISGTWTLSEYRRALRTGYRPDKIYKIIYWYQKENLFKKWVDYVYNIRKMSENQAETYILKILQNSLYGKFGQRRDKDEILFLNDGDSINGLEMVSGEYGIFKRKKFTTADFIMPHIASHVTSFARLELFKYLNDNSYYCDTDSVFTRDKFNVSKELGAMKLEESKIDAQFYLPKLYKTTSKYKAKGFNKPDRKIDDSEKSYTEKLDIWFQRIIDKEEIKTERVMSFKQSCRSKVPFGSKKVLTKAVKSSYNKRRVLSNGDTEPFTIAEWRKIHGSKKHFRKGN